MSGFVQLSGPSGPWYVRPEMVAAVGPAHRDSYHFIKAEEDIRVVSVRGGYSNWIFDRPENMGKLL